MMVCQSQDWPSRSISFFYSLLDSCLDHENNPGPACWMVEDNLGLRKVVSDKAYKTSQSLDFFFFFQVLGILSVQCLGLCAYTAGAWVQSLVRAGKKKKKSISPQLSQTQAQAHRLNKRLLFYVVMINMNCHATLLQQQITVPEIGIRSQVMS